MHQNPALRQRLRAAILVWSGGGLSRIANQFWSFSLVGECRGVLQHKDGTFSRIRALRARSEMPAENIVLADSIIGPGIDRQL